MNFWTGLIAGIIIGWLVEWIIDWLFWRRDAEEAGETERLLEERLAAAEAEAAGASADLEAQLAAAEEAYQTRLRAVEEEWQSRLNLNEQQWQDNFRALEADNSELRGRVADTMAGATLAAAGVVVAGELAGDDEEATRGAPDDVVLTDEMVVTEWIDEDIEPIEEGAEWLDADIAAGGDLLDLEEMNSDVAERLHLAGIDSVDALAAADPAVLAVAMGLRREETEVWVDRAAATLEQPVGPTIALYQDDLTRVHGIGPKFAALLAGAGITSYDDLAAATPEQLRDIIKPGPMQQINFGSWSAQAAALAGTRSSRVGDDLTEIEGIGPVYAARLREGGIGSFAELAAADEATLAALIAAPAWRRVNYGDWIAQAQLAAAGDRAGLSEMQSRLNVRGGDNLGLIHGMGSRSVAALQAAGITTFAALAAATPQQLESALHEAGVRGSYDYEAWISEAGVRAAGKRVSTGRARPTHVVPCPQDLSAVPGVGPVLEERLYAAGIGSYWELAETPTTELAATLHIGSLPGVDLDAIKAAAMRLAVESNSLGRAWDGTPPDDFEVLPGIGEVYERRLYEAGICTFDALAATPPERLVEICKAPPMRAPDYAAWVSLAAERVAARRSA